MRMIAIREIERGSELDAGRYGATSEGTTEEIRWIRGIASRPSNSNALDSFS